MNEFTSGLDSVFSKILSKENIYEATEIQKIVIPHLLEKNDNIIFSSQTGTGKTYAYLLPILQNITPNDETQVVIIAPTLELCAQIKTKTDFLLQGLAAEKTTAHINAVLLTGSGNIKHQVDALKKSKPEIIIGNTKRILQLAEQRKLRLSRTRFVVLDEVDRLISAELLDETAVLLSLIKNESLVCAACSATVSKRHIDQVQKLLGKDFVFKQSESSEILQNNISHFAIWSEERRKIETLRSFISAVDPKKALVFTDKSDDVCNIVSKLQYRKKSVGGIYSGMDKKERKLALENFIQGSFNILVSSDLAARGLDIPNIKYIIQLTVPENSDIYVHRAGRTARAGKKGIMVSIGAEKDLRHLQNIEKKLRIKVFPKVLYGGKLLAPEDLENPKTQDEV
ncbi:MAG: DEAD/DEAH box helicase [Termitinemataceae bacterium]|nr:MAG: DEAD/DEAH box helicase [Termitinemataceae bacterium]